MQKRRNEIESIEHFGRKITATLEMERVLAGIVEAAVEISGAEEGRLLLPDETTGELFVCASRGFQEGSVNTVRTPVQDPLAGEVFKTGKPIIRGEKTPRKVGTDHAVHAFIGTPIIAGGRVMGVLEVGNCQPGRSFQEDHVALLSALSDYAAIALENAQRFTRAKAERSKLEAILSEVENGVIVADYDGRLILINRKACEAFGVHEDQAAGKRVRDLIQHQDLLEVLRDEELVAPTRIEITLKDGRVMNTEITPIPDLGLVVIMQDITHLKELDRIKTEFVSTVSHDLRSPLTAILGYIELMDRVGPVNAQQQEYVRWVQASVHAITSLINDLLDLGRIESGFDARKEILPFNSILEFAVEQLRNKAAEKSQNLVVDISENLPYVLGNPTRLRQLVTNLLANAIKYTQESGEIRLRAIAEESQVILQVADNGPGIPAADQPYIFDKFYRASNVAENSHGTGLGLAIVKSIVENHLGRIWVESVAGQGAVFTVVLPSVDSKL